jgi:hypothetical protein
VSTTEQIYALLVAANPVPDPETSPEPVAQTRPHLHVVDPRRSVMQTQHEPQQNETAKHLAPHRRTPGWIWAAAAFIMVTIAVAAVVMVRSGSGEAPVADSDSDEPIAVSTTTDVEAPTTVPATETPAQIPVVESANAAYNSYDAGAYAAYWAEGIEGPGGYIVGSDDWHTFIAQEQARGIEITLSDCEATDNAVTCLETYQETLLSGKAGIVLTWEAEYTFNENGLIVGFARFNNTGAEAIGPFEDALGRWMATTHPEVFETYYVPDFYTRKYENWFTPQGATQLSQLIDEFITDSNEYPLNP